METIGYDALFEKLRPLADLKVMDLVAEAGVDVRRWAFKQDGQPVANPRANPNYCYEWAFGDGAEPIVLCVWHTSLAPHSEGIAYQGNLRARARALEEIALDRKESPETRSRAKNQAKRCDRFDFRLQRAYRNNLPLRVILLEGERADRLGHDASQVSRRHLDDSPWHVHAYDDITGAFTMLRGEPTAPVSAREIELWATAESRINLSALLKRICELQPKYSSSNTMEMQERGRLIRSDLSQQIRGRLPELIRAFDPLFDDLAVEGSDGIGRKTEAPWVRLYSKSMSPTPREGYYVVIHFAADGSACFFTIGCGSTVWNGGDLRPVSDEELKTKTSWARNVVRRHWGTLAPFTDVIKLRARAPLPRTFEKATAIAQRIAVESIDHVDLDDILLNAAARLSEIYLAQLDQRDMAPGDQDALELATIVKPLRRRNRAQGIGLTAVERRVVELRAMLLATQFLESQGFTCQDKCAVESFDILAERNGEVLKIEVKGTTSDLCDSVLMTRNEVNLHRLEKGQTGLLIVSRIQLVRSGEVPSAVGGSVEALMRWDIDQWMLEPVAFQVRRSRMY